jgi:PAS domain S-box-containing protein
MKAVCTGREGKHFRLFVEAASNAMLVVDQRRRIELVNRATEQLFGYSRDELIGQPVEMLVPDRFHDVHPRLAVGFLAAPSTRPMGAGTEPIGRRKDGTELPLEIGLSPISFGGRMFVVASLMDVTERRGAHDWFRRILEVAPNAAIVVDSTGRISLANRAAERLFGYERDELVGRPVEVLVPETTRADHSGHVQSFYADPVARPMGAGRDLFGRRKDGTEVPIEIGLNPIDAPRGRSTVASIVDITERKRREDELRRSNAELEQFAYVASHDLQEPLRMVANYTELLAKRYRGRLDETADRYIHYASDGARRMQRLVSDLLAVSRIGSQGRPLVPVSAKEALAAAIESLRTIIRDSGARIEAGPLPDVLADPTQLRQLLQNLVANAIKFRSEAPPVVSITATQHADEHQFSVTDNGIGIDPRYADRIFQMFQRLHPRSEYDGSGIGLAIAQRIVERHGGRIWLESRGCAGTTFHFTLATARRGDVP